MSGFFTVVLLASLAGVLLPFWGMRRRHFALTAFGAFIGVGAFAPAPTPQEIAAKEADKAREAAEEVQIAAKDRAEEERELAEARRSEHDRVVEKTRLALEVPPNYTQSEYRQTYSRVGAATFARLNRLEPGAAYVAAESRSCDRVTAAMMSDRSKPANAI